MEKELHTAKLQRFLNSTHCKILEWQVMNEKKKHLGLNSRKGSSECF